jgi:hypothetical protein
VNPEPYKEVRRYWQVTFIAEAALLLFGAGLLAYSLSSFWNAVTKDDWFWAVVWAITAGFWNAKIFLETLPGQYEVRRRARKLMRDHKDNQAQEDDTND